MGGGCLIKGFFNKKHIPDVRSVVVKCDEHRQRGEKRPRVYVNTGGRALLFGAYGRANASTQRITGRACWTHSQYRPINGHKCVRGLFETEQTAFEVHRGKTNAENVTGEWKHCINSFLCYSLLR